MERREEMKGDQPHNDGIGMKKKTATLTTHASIIRPTWRSWSAASDFAIRERRIYQKAGRRRLHIEEDGSTSEESGRKCR